MFLPVFMTLPINHISVSMLNQWESCPHCWVLKYIEKKPQEPYQPFIDGSNYHKEVDKYHKGLKYKKRLIHKYTETYPQDYRTQSEIRFTRALHYNNWTCPIPLVGIIDGYRDSEIVDLKFAKNKPNPENDIQGIIYSWIYWMKQGEFPVFTWNWVNKVNGKVKNISTKYTIKDIEFMVSKIDNFFEKIQQPVCVIKTLPARPFMNSHYHECPNYDV